MAEYVNITAGSPYGHRTCWYELVDPGYLVLIEEGDHDNLAGNRLAADFSGLTIAEAEEQIAAYNSEPVGHSFDGCHACKWHIDLDETPDDVPAHIVHNNVPVTKRIARLESLIASLGKHT